VLELRWLVGGCAYGYQALTVNGEEKERNNRRRWGKSRLIRTGSSVVVGASIGRRRIERWSTDVAKKGQVRAPDQVET
jgi:hypothetical protein